MAWAGGIHDAIDRVHERLRDDRGSPSPPLPSGGNDKDPPRAAVGKRPKSSTVSRAKPRWPSRKPSPGEFVTDLERQFQEAMELKRGREFARDASPTEKSSDILRPWWERNEVEGRRSRSVKDDRGERRGSGGLAPSSESIRSRSPFQYPEPPHNPGKRGIRPYSASRGVKSFDEKALFVAEGAIEGLGEMAISDSQLRKIYMRIPRKSDAIKSVVSIDDAIQTLRELSRVYKEARNRLKEDKDKEDSPKASKNDLKAWIAEQKSLQRQGGKDEAAKALSWETKFERGQTEDRSVPHRSEGLFEDDASPEQRQPQAVRFKLDDDERKLDLETSIGVEKSIDDLRACDSTIEGYSYVKGDADDIRDVQAAVTPSTASSPPRSTPATASGPSASPMSEDVVPFEDLIPQSVPDALRKAAEFLEQARRLHPPPPSSHAGRTSWTSLTRSVATSSA
ncbi:hypothetical protein GUITHDRAFT_112047 [Guillardia theta CCMP2712]|uniref:Uncharacterized protein n=1 Tax=Guillardia theta (strain CCMP2712) TaxID=905079 RepID=L1J0T5_GUITC|nr:hypothetical protein GUITHDRAFT_112047 [Guillardia theta CCMP2712]EKX41912.1 hypothetical protein GUITHDRAFT_112047 [Guillardia theta CCMP2712]|eukprot:XP_005828892.1 hypothetical protein GUITHDRAFT_112047 [Guillardia theta CCMP2712]